jgi:hypothetical protein
MGSERGAEKDGETRGLEAGFAARLEPCDDRPLKTVVLLLE